MANQIILIKQYGEDDPIWIPNVIKRTTEFLNGVKNKNIYLSKTDDKLVDEINDLIIHIRKVSTVKFEARVDSMIKNDMRDIIPWIQNYWNRYGEVTTLVLLTILVFPFAKQKTVKLLRELAIMSSAGRGAFNGIKNVLKGKINIPVMVEMFSFVNNGFLNTTIWKIIISGFKDSLIFTQLFNAKYLSSLISQMVKIDKEMAFYFIGKLSSVVTKQLENGKVLARLSKNTLISEYRRIKSLFWSFGTIFNWQISAPMLNLLKSLKIS